MSFSAQKSLQVLLALLTLPSFAADKPVPTVVYQGATLIDTATGTVKPNMAIFVQGQRIVDVRPSEKVVPKAGQETVDLTGKFVMPGLVNTHVHTATLAVPAVAKAYLRRELYSGVTTVRDMAGDVRLLSEIQREAEADEIPSPDLFYVALFAGPDFFADPRTHDSARGRIAGQVPWMQAITAQTNLARAVAEARGTGATAIKLYADLPASLVQAITAEAHRQGLLVWSHAAVFPALPSDIAKAGVDVMSHACLLGYQLSDPPPLKVEGKGLVDAAKVMKGSSTMAALFQEMKTQGTLLDATLLVYDSGEVRSCSPDVSAHLARDAFRAGVQLSVGTDDDPNWDDANSAIYTELSLLVEKAGMTAADALRAATLIGARAAGQEEDTGSVEVGKLANLLVLDQNPLESIANVRSVFLVVKHGIRYPRSEYKAVTSQEMKGYPLPAQ
jgi:imidazolonepropionase-like amidohydrolase